MNAPRATLVLLLLLALPGCLNEYHPEYHPETVYAYTQTVRVEEPRPQPTIVILTSQPPPSPLQAQGDGQRAEYVRLLHVVEQRRRVAAGGLPDDPPTRAFVPPREPKATAVHTAPPVPAFQAAPAFAADDRAR